MAKNKYVSDDDYFEANYVIYNDLSPTLLPHLSEVLDSPDQKFVQAVLKEGEQWVDLSLLGYPGYVLTSYGRTLNTIKRRLIKCRINSQSMHLYILGDYIDVVGIFKKQGWDWNIDTIRSYFDKYNWRYTKV